LNYSTRRVAKRGVSMAAAVLCAAGVSAEPITVSGRIGVGPRIGSYTDYQSGAAGGSALDLRLETAFTPMPSGRATLGFDSRITRSFAGAREQRAFMTFAQDLRGATGQPLSYVLDYRVLMFDHRLVADRDFTENDLRVSLAYRPVERLSTFCTFRRIGRAVKQKTEGFVVSAFDAGGTLWLNGRRDTLALRGGTAAKDARIDARTHTRRHYTADYTHSFDNLDEMGVYLSEDSLRYDPLGSAADSDGMTLRLSYVDARPDGSRWWVGERQARAYPGDAAVGYEQYAVSVKRRRDEAAGRGELITRNRITHYHHTARGGNDYTHCSWGTTGYTPRERGKRWYVDHDLAGRFWRNDDPSTLREQYVEDTISVGMQAHARESGSFNAGPLVGGRFYINPRARDNSLDTDDALLGSPHNIIIYGARAAGGCMPIAEVSLVGSIEYRRFVAYRARPVTTANELTRIALAVTQRLSPALRMVGKLDVSRHLNDTGAAVQEADRFQLDIRVEYDFAATFREDD